MLPIVERLFDAIEAGDIRAIAICLNDGADVSGVYPTVTRVEIEEEISTEELISRGRRIKREGRSPLLWACFCQQLGAVQELVEAGADINADHSVFGTALHDAVSSGSTEICEYLILAGADVDFRRKKDGKAPLHDTTTQLNVEIAAVLLQHGADVNSLDAMGCTALDTACLYADRRLADLLISAGGRNEKIDPSPPRLEDYAHSRPSSFDEVDARLKDGGLSGEWENLAAAMQPGDTLHFVSSSQAAWDELMGSEGVVLVRDGVVVNGITTAMN